MGYTNGKNAGVLKMNIKHLICVVVSLVSFVAFAYYQSIEDQVSHKMRGMIPQISQCCEDNDDIFNEAKCRSLQCKDIDKLGGQPVVSPAVCSIADKWIENNLSAVSRYYLRTIPKTNLVIDKQKKIRQDSVMEVVDELRKVIRYAYCQTLALQLPEDRFKDIAVAYKKLMRLNAWKELGDRQGAKVLKATDSLGMLLNKIHLINVSIYDMLLVEKQRRYAVFATAHPETAQSALAMQRAKKAEARAACAESEAYHARRSANAANARAAQAEAAAAQAQADAEAANRRANSAEHKAMFGF